MFEARFPSASVDVSQRCLDVVGSSRIARSFKSFYVPTVQVAGTRTGAWRFLLGTRWAVAFAARSASTRLVEPDQIRSARHRVRQRSNERWCETVCRRASEVLTVLSDSSA